MRSILTIMALCFCILACKKEKTPSPGLIGKWELRRVYGGLSYRDSVYKPGNGNFYIFSNDSTYARFVNNAYNASGTFHYKKNGYDPGNGNKYDEILFDNTIYGEMLILGETKLTIGNTWTDGIAEDYVKVADK